LSQLLLCYARTGRRFSTMDNKDTLYSWYYQEALKIYNIIKICIWKGDSLDSLLIIKLKSAECHLWGMWSFCAPKLTFRRMIFHASHHLITGISSLKTWPTLLNHLNKQPNHKHELFMADEYHHGCHFLAQFYRIILFSTQTTSNYWEYW